MAVPRGIGVMFLDEAARTGWTGSVLQLGRQSVYLTERELAGRRGPGRGVAAFVDDVKFFCALGFDMVHASDLGGEGDPTHSIDLNEPVPTALVGRYDAVFDGGTLGLVFDPSAALSAVHDLLAPGGRAIHIVSSNNFVDGGFYLPSPGLLHRWYEGSGYELELCRIVATSRRWARGRIRSWDYEPGMLDGLVTGGFERGMLLTVVVARKTGWAEPRVPYYLGGSRLAFRSDPVGIGLRRLATLARPLLPSRVVPLVPRRALRGGQRW